MFFDSTSITGLDYRDEFYDEIYQDTDCEDIEQHDIDLEADDETTEGKKGHLNLEHKKASKAIQKARRQFKIK